MNLSNIIEAMISDMLEERDEVEFQRNVMAQSLGCVPSQINYVLSSRFTPERGFIVESRRGGGGFIKIARISSDKDTLLMHVVNSVGFTLDERTMQNHVMNLVYKELLSKKDANIILSIAGNNTLRSIPQEYRDNARAAIFKQALLAVIQNQ